MAGSSITATSVGLGSLGAASAGASVVRDVESAVRLIEHLGPREAAIDAGLTLAIIAGAVALGRSLDWLLRKGAARINHGAGPGRPAIATLSARLTRLAIVAGAGFLILEVWGLAPLQWLDGPGGRATLRVGLLTLLGVAAVEICGRLIDRLFRGLEHHSQDPRRAAQFHTLSPIVRGLANGLLLILIGLTVLSELGVKIGPLLAGAGVVGVALGFGAQTLVKDFITGLFLIVEDIVSVGDTVRIGGFGGKVETMTLRTIRLRDIDGTLHVFPYSEAQIIHNQTKSISFAVFTPQVSYVSDIERAIAIMREVGEALQKEAPFGEMILEALEVFGVDQFTDVGVVVKARMKTRPGDQWRVGREYQRRLKLAFDAEGIEIGHPNIDADRTAISARRNGQDADGEHAGAEAGVSAP